MLAYHLWEQFCNGIVVLFNAIDLQMDLQIFETKKMSQFMDDHFLLIGVRSVINP